MEGESRVLAGEIWVASALVEEALADVVGDSDRLHAFKYAVLGDWKASRLPLADAVENDLCICLFLRFLLHAAIPYFDNCFTGMSLSDPRWTKRRKFLTQAQYDSAKSRFCELFPRFFLNNRTHFVFYSLDPNIQENKLKLFPPPPR